MEKESKFSRGDTVKLKCGSSPMVIEQVNKRLVSARNLGGGKFYVDEYLYTCIYCNEKGDIKNVRLIEETLKKF